MTGHITYKEMTLMYGPKAAHALLRVIEASAGTDRKIIPFDYEERISRAFEAFSGDRAAA